MTDTLVYRGELTVITCWCGTRHAVPRELRDYQLRQFDSGATPISLYCPLGHTHIPSGTPEVEKERKRRERAEARAQHLADQLQATERSKSALKGQLTKAHKRAANGVCPCCNRSFVDVARHVKTKHPGFEPAA